MSHARWWGAVLTAVVAAGAHGAEVPCRAASTTGAKTAADCAAKPARDGSRSDCRGPASGGPAARCAKPLAVAGAKSARVPGAGAAGVAGAKPAATTASSSSVSGCTVNCSPKVATKVARPVAGKPAARGATPGKEGEAAPLALAKPAAEHRDPDDRRRLLERAEKFEEAVRAEARGQWQAAMRLYQDAAIEGYGPAQRRLGAIYQSGNAVVQRDYESALLWYERARASGEKITEPRRSIGFRTGP